MAILLTKGEAQLTMCIQSHTHMYTQSQTCIHAYTCAHRVKYSHIHTHRELLNAYFIRKLV